MKPIEAIISSLRVAMTDARQNESHFESWMILNEAICDAIDALAEQSAQQEPVKIEYWLQDTMESGRWVTTDNMARATAEKMLSGEYGDVYPQGRIVEPSPQPAQQQEPVAWATQLNEYAHIKWDALRPEYPMVYEFPLYTSPPASKPWVGLTRKQVDDLTDDGVFLGNIYEITAAIEAKLKEKNA